MSPAFENAAVLVLLVAARAAAVVWWVPAFGGPHVSAPVRVGLAAALATLVAPQVGGEALAIPSPLAFVGLVGREIAVGAGVGFLVACAFRAAEAAGRLVDVFRGAGMAEVLAPATGERSSPVGSLYQLLAVLVFVEIGGLGHVGVALARSYEAVPLKWAPLHLEARPLVALAALSAARLLESAVGLAAPALVALLLADVALGVLGRFAPQVPLHFVGMPFKALAGVGVVLVGLGGLHAALAGELHGWVALWERGFSVWR